MKQPSKYSSSYRNRQKNGRYRSPYRLYFWLSLLLTVALAALLVYLKLPVYLAYLAGINLVTFGLYGYDKAQAKRGGGRVPELILHCLAILGGALGGLAGQWLFHHKLRKPVFHLILWASLLAHLVIFALFYHTLVG